MDEETALRQVNELLKDGRTREAREICEFTLMEMDERRKAYLRRLDREARFRDTDDVFERARVIEAREAGIRG